MPSSPRALKRPVFGRLWAYRLSCEARLQHDGFIDLGANHAARDSKPRPVARLVESGRAVQLVRRKQSRQEREIAGHAIKLPCPEVDLPRTQMKPACQL